MRPLFLATTTLLGLVANLAAQTGATPTPRAAAATVRAATRAVEADSVRQAERRWRARPPSDREAQLGLATLARLTYRWDEADRRYRDLLPAAGTAPDPIQVQAALGLASGLASRLQTAEAAALVAPLLSATAAGPAQRAETMLVLARLAARAGADSVVRLLRQAGTLVPATDTALAALQRCALASALRTRADAEPDSLLAQGLALARAAADRRAEGRCQLAIGQHQQGRGRARLAYEALREANRLFRQTRDYEAAAISLQWTAFLGATQMSQFAMARRAARDAVSYGVLSGNQLPVAYAYLNLGQIGLRLGDAVVAFQAAAAAESAFVALADRQGVANAWMVRADAADLTGDLPRARAALERADSTFRAVGINARAGIALRLAAISREAGDTALAGQLLRESVRVAEQQRAGGILNTDRHYYAGLLSLDRGDFPAARASFEAFLAGAGPQAFHYRVDGNLRIAETLAREGRFDQALAMFTDGSLSLARVREVLEANPKDLAGREREIMVSLLHGRRFDFDTDLGVATMVSAFARAGRVADAFQIAEQERARYLLGALTRREAAGRDSARGLGRRGRVVGPVFSLDSVRAQLPIGTALLHFTTGRGGEPTTLITATREQATAWTLPPADSLLDRIDRFTRALEAGQPAIGLASELGAALLDSALTTLTPVVSRLVIVPDGPLHRVPFDALVLRDGRRVVERAAVGLAPSARLAGLAPSLRTPAAVVAFGDPQFDPATALPRLPASAEEARSAAGTWSGGRAFTGRAATEVALTRESARATILHLATHARVQDWGVMTSALYLGAGENGDGSVSVAEITDLPLDRTALVVLSGCRTLGGMITTGEGVQGLTAPFLEAGARAVVATYWQVGDRAAAGFTKRFYAELRGGVTVVEALHAAKRKAAQAGESPASWAAFSVTGDGGVRFSAP